MKPLYLRMVEAAAILDELNSLYDFPPGMPWDAQSLRSEAPVVASIETEMAGAPS